MRKLRYVVVIQERNRAVRRAVALPKIEETLFTEELALVALKPNFFANAKQGFRNPEQDDVV